MPGKLSRILWIEIQLIVGMCSRIKVLMKYWVGLLMFKVKKISVKTWIVVWKNCQFLTFLLIKRALLKQFPQDNQLLQTMDFYLLFQRIIVIVSQSTTELNHVFIFELSTLPPCLLFNSRLMNEANKPQLSDASWEVIRDNDSNLPNKARDTLDGVLLRQIMSWTNGQTFENIANLTLVVF